MTDPALKAQLLRVARRLEQTPTAEFSPVLWVKLAAFQPLLAEPGTNYHYSNIGFEILGLIAARASGQSIESLYRERIFEPLGLTHTAYDPQGPISGQHARGYNVGPDGRLIDMTAAHAGIGAEGAVVSNAEDTAHFLVSLMQGKLLGPEQLALMKQGGFWSGGNPTGCGDVAYGHSGGGARLQDRRLGLRQRGARRRPAAERSRRRSGGRARGCDDAPALLRVHAARADERVVISRSARTTPGGSIRNRSLLAAARRGRPLGSPERAGVRVDRRTRGRADRHSTSTTPRSRFDVPEGPVVIEMTPIPDRYGARRGVVAEGPVGSRWTRRLRFLRYELRRWPGGVIPDAAEAVASPVRLSESETQARRLLELVPFVPTAVWGRDELHTGEMWTSNSVTSWLLAPQRARRRPASHHRQAGALLAGARASSPPGRERRRRHAAGR